MSRVVACALLIAVALVGCGSKSAQEQFHDSAQAICEKTAKRAGRADEGAGSRSEFAFLSQAYSVLSAARKELQALKPPPRLQTAYAGFLAALKREQPALVQLAANEHLDDRRQTRAILARIGRNGLLARTATLGLPACAVNEPGRFAR